MSVRYVGVQWNRFKLVYDGLALAAAAGFIAMFERSARMQLAGNDQLSAPALQMRALAAPPSCCSR